MTVPINKMSNIEVVGLGALNIDHMYRVEGILDRARDLCYS